MTFSIFDAARDHPAGLALDGACGPVTFDALATAVDAALPSLRAKNPEGRPLAFVATPDLPAVTLLHAALELGWPVVPLHPRSPPTDRESLVQATGSVFIEPSALDAGAPTPRPPRVPEDDRPLAFLRTSGGEGKRPKIAVLSRAALAAAAVASAARLGWRDDDRWLLSLPFAHVGGLSVLLRCLRARRTVVLCLPGTDPFAAATQGRATIASLVPTQLARLVEAKVRAPSTLRVVLLGGAAAASRLVDDALALGWPVVPTYGLTETGSQAATVSPASLPYGERGCGRPLDGFEVRVVDGVLEVRGKALFSGYWSDGRLLPGLDGDGWFRTGDVGEVDAGGRVHVHGRADEVIITGGEKVLPARVEAALLASPLVEAACVFGVPDPLWGELVAVAVVARAPLVPQALVQALASLAPHERPRRFALVDALATNATGKVDRAAVRLAAAPLLVPLGR